MESMNTSELINSESYECEYFEIAPFGAVECAMKCMSKTQTPVLNDNHQRTGERRRFQAVI